MKYERWSLGYWLLKQYVRYANWLILKQTIITGREKIPGNKPIVFAPNHQNALSDPMAVLLNTHFQPVWLARADIFGKNSIIDTILRFLKIIPVYRLRDGKENLDKNQDTFSTSIRVLQNNSALALFPEAAHTFKRHMMPHKKAVPRIVFMAEEQTGNKLDIQIIPTGIHYSHYWKFNRTLIVNFGDPIPVSDYLESYSQNPNAATTDLKARIHSALLPLIINIKSKKHYNEFERIRELYGLHFLNQNNLAATTLNAFHSDRQLVKLLDKLEKKDARLTEEICSEANSFRQQIMNYKLRPWILNRPGQNLWKLLTNLLILLATLPLFIYGFVFNALPFFLIDHLIRNKVKDQSFWSSFFLVAGIVLFPVYYLLLIPIVLSFLSGGLVAAAFMISLPFAGKLAFKWYILSRKTTGLIRFEWIKRTRNSQYRELLTAKASLFEKIDKALNSLQPPEG